MTFALIALLFSAPVILLLGIAIRIDTAGPVFYSQVRLGQHGTRFRLLKLRKFAHDAPDLGIAVTLRSDPRMTRVGRILERTKLDELPQLVNVLRGDMAVVGPRPELPGFADCFDSPWGAILDHKPGLCGPSQVLLRHEALLYPAECDPNTFYREVLFLAKAQVDLEYYPKRTLRSDIIWIAQCIYALFRAPETTGWKSAEGAGPTAARSAELPLNVPSILTNR